MNEYVGLQSVLSGERLVALWTAVSPGSIVLLMSPKAISACKCLWNWSQDTRAFILDEQNLCLALADD